MVLLNRNQHLFTSIIKSYTTPIYIYNLRKIQFWISKVIRNDSSCTKKISLCSFISRIWKKSKYQWYKIFRIHVHLYWIKSTTPDSFFTTKSPITGYIIYLELLFRIVRFDVRDGLSVGFPFQMRWWFLIFFVG